MLPFASGVNHFFFRFREILFRLRFLEPLSLSRGAFMLLFAFEVNRFFHQRTNFLPVLSAFKNQDT